MADIKIYGTLKSGLVGTPIIDREDVSARVEVIEAGSNTDYMSLISERFSTNVVEGDMAIIQVDGTTQASYTYSDSAWIKINETVSIDRGDVSARVEVISINSGQDVDATINAAFGGDIQEGDMAITTQQIAGDKKSYTAYVYQDGVWTAMDGNYNADNVYFDTDLTYTAGIGALVAPTAAEGSKTLEASGKNIKEVLQAILAQAKNPSVTQPSITVNSSNIGLVEVGTTRAIQYTITTNPGSYTYGPATGVTFSGFSATFNNQTLQGSSGTFASVQVTDSTNLSISASASHGAGADPKNNLGTIVADLKITAGTKTATKGTLKGYRNTFYGTWTETKDLNSTNIRGLSGKSNAAWTDGKTFNITIPVGAKRVVFAYPKTLGTVNKVLDVNGLNANITGAFTETTVLVNGAENYTPIEYYVYYTDYANANDKANTYTVTI